VAPPAAVSPEEKRGRRLLTAIVAINAASAVLLLASLAIGTTLMMAKLNVREPVKEEDPTALPGPSLEVADAIYNLGEVNRYMRASMQVELDVAGMDEKAQAEAVMEAKARLPWIQDLIVTEVSGKTYRALAEPAGREQFKEELKVAIDAMLTRARVKRIVFTSFAVQ
jgi:flagellar basal body-associated protein FliL